MRTIVHIARKELLLRWRDRLGFFWWMVGFPLLIAVLIGSIFAGVLRDDPRAVTVAVVDEAGSPEVARFIAILSEARGIAVVRQPRAEADEMVRRGGASALLILPREFKVTAGVLAGDRLPAVVGVDPSRRAQGLLVQSSLRQAVIQHLRERWFDVEGRRQMVREWMQRTHPDTAPAPAETAAVQAAADALADYMQRNSSAQNSTWDPSLPFGETYVVAADSRPRSSFEICFPLGIAWGLIGLAAEFAMALVHERDVGTALRIRTAPIARWQVLAGSGLACFAAALGVMLLLLIVGRVFFGVRAQSLPVLAVAVLSTAWCLVGLTMFLSVLGNTESSVGGAAWAFLLVLAVIGGAMVPQIFMPAWMDKVGGLSPVRWMILGLEGGIWRGFSLRDMLRPSAMLMTEGFVFGLAGLVIMSRRER